MGLSSNMWASVSGLLQHGEKMGVIGNNIANISTIGFKSQRMDFEDLIYQDSFSAGGPTQLGRGVGTSAIMGDFSQGGTESTNDPTDLLISGSGFFEVSDPYSDQVYYTRAGNFRFDNEGVLRNPQGLALQGWDIPSSSGASISVNGQTEEVFTQSAMQGVGNPEDIRFDAWTLAARQTSYVEATVNLNSASGFDRSSDPANPMFSLFNTWDGSQPANPVDKPPIAEASYMYPSSVTVYDEGGKPRELTTYYDQITTGLDKDKNELIKNLPSSYSVYEYMVTMDPKEDARTYGGVFDEATGRVVDDPLTWTGYTSISIADAQAKGGLAATGTFAATNMAVADMTTKLNAAIDQLNLALTPPPAPTPTASALTAADIKIAQYPNGDYYLDPKDPNVAKVIAAIDDATITGGTAAEIKTAATPSTTIFGDPNGTPPTVIAPADVKNQNNVNYMADSKSAGVLMMGVMVFDGAGNLVNQSAYTYLGQTDFPENGVPNQDPNNLANWEPAPISNSGYPVFTPNFSGHPLANAPLQNAGDGNSIDQKDAASYLIEYNVGRKSKLISNAWSNPNSNAASMGNDYAAMATFTNSEKSGIEPSQSRLESSSSNRATQDGYTFGSLSNYHVDQNGVLYGIYSNGQTVAQYQVSIFDFVNEQGLRREGGNLYSATQDSGQPRVGPAGQAGLGTISAYSIEQSNVDLSREFVQMISTQRGYQANSKSITTTDSMLETVINIVR